MSKKRRSSRRSGKGWSFAAGFWVSVLVVASVLAAAPGVAIHWKVIGVFTLLITGAVLGLIGSDRQSDVLKGRTPKTASQYLGLMGGALVRTIYAVIIITSWVIVLVMVAEIRFAPVSSEPIRVGLDEIHSPWKRQKWVTIVGAAPLRDGGFIIQGRGDDGEWENEHYGYPIVGAEHPGLEELSALDSDETLDDEERERATDALVETMLPDVRVLLRHEIDLVDAGDVDFLEGRSNEITGILYRPPKGIGEDYHGRAEDGSPAPVLMLYARSSPPFPLAEALFWMALGAAAMSACIWHWRRIGLSPPGSSEEDQSLGRTIVKVCVVLAALSAVVVGLIVGFGLYLG